MYMRSMLYILVTTLMMSTGLYGQSDLREDNLIRDFNSYSKALINGDYDKVMSLIHPSLVEMSGGSLHVIADLRTDRDMYKQSGMSLITLNPKLPSKIITAGHELHVMLPCEEIFVDSGKEYRAQNFFLAASADNGATWTFIDMKKQDEQSIKIFLPHYDDRLNVYLIQSKKMIYLKNTPL